MIAAIIQARMGSTRLAGKTLAQVAGEPLLQRVVQRARASSLIDEVIIATTSHSRDDVLAKFAEAQGLKYYRGSEDDVLDRIYQTAHAYQVDHIVRVTPDCPLIDPKVIDQVIDPGLLGNRQSRA